MSDASLRKGGPTKKNVKRRKDSVLSALKSESLSLIKADLSRGPEENKGRPETNAVWQLEP